MGCVMAGTGTSTAYTLIPAKAWNKLRRSVVLVYLTQNCYMNRVVYTLVTDVINVLKLFIEEMTWTNTYRIHRPHTD